MLKSCALLGKTVGVGEIKMQLSPLKQFEKDIEYGIILVYTSAQLREMQQFLIRQSFYTDPFKPRSEINSNFCTICALSATAVSRCNLNVDDNKPRFCQSTCMHTTFSLNEKTDYSVLFFLKQAHALFNLYQKPEKKLSKCPSEHETNFEVGL